MSEKVKKFKSLKVKKADYLLSKFVGTTAIYLLFSIKLVAQLLENFFTFSLLNFFTHSNASPNQLQ